MSLILDKLRSEYRSEYQLMNYKIPKIYPKIVTSKPKSAFSSAEKKELVKKRWYIYYSFRNPETGIMEKQSPIYFNVNRDFPEFEDRLQMIKDYRNTLENILKKGFSPYEDDEIKPQYTSEGALDFVLELKKHEVKPVTFKDYQERLNQFKEFLRKERLLRKSIKQIDKKVVNKFLNSILRKTSPSNRNNTRTVLSSLFTKLVQEDFINSNFIKDGIPVLKSKPEKNKAFSKSEVFDILEYFKKEDENLYNFCCHVFYGLFRPIEVVRIKVKNVNLEKKIIFSDTKTSKYYKQIPNVLMPFYNSLNLVTKLKNDFIFTLSGVGKWDTAEINKRGYFSKRFRKLLDRGFDFSKEYTIYSLRHTAIGILFEEKVKEYKAKGIPDFEESALSYIRKITNHKSNDVVRNYLREIGFYKIADWSDLMK